RQPAKDRQFFCGFGSDPNDDRTQLSIQHVCSELGKSKAGMKVLLVDACRDSVGARGVPREAGEGVASVTYGPDVTGLIVYCSCSPSERSWEVGELKHGLFFHR